MASHNAPSPTLAFPADEEAKDALWLAELIRGVGRFAEDAGQPEVARILDQARVAAQATAGIPSDQSLN